MKLSKKKISSRRRHKKIKQLLRYLKRHKRTQQIGGSIIQLSPGRTSGKVVGYTRRYF